MNSLETNLNHLSQKITDNSNDQMNQMKQMNQMNYEQMNSNEGIS